MTSSGKRLPALLAIILALLSGSLVFINYLFHPSILIVPAQFLLKVVVLTTGAAILMAAFNLLRGHVQRGAQKDVGSLLLIGAFIITFIAGLLPGAFRTGVGAWLYQWLLAPGLAALFALLPIFLAYALFRHLSVRTLGGFLLFLGLIIVLLGQTPSLVAFFPIVANTRQRVLTIPAAMAFRGVILGLAVGVILGIFLKAFALIQAAPAHRDGGDGE